MWRGLVGLAAGVGLAVAAQPASAEEVVKVGQSFTVSLPWSANVTWTPVLDGDAAKKLEYTGAGPAPGGVPGGANLREYNFKAKEAGRVSFTMERQVIGVKERTKVTVSVTVR